MPRHAPAHFAGGRWAEPATTPDADKPAKRKTAPTQPWGIEPGPLPAYRKKSGKQASGPLWAGNITADGIDALNAWLTKAP
jgi:hypothetical protein